MLENDDDLCDNYKTGNDDINEGDDWGNNIRNGNNGDGCKRRIEAVDNLKKRSRREGIECKG